MIISASRRTDLPAFFTPWMMNRFRAGFLLSRNPNNRNQISRVSLLPEDVDAVVFWTRNPEPLMAHLDELDALGHRYYFQFTLTGYPRWLERGTPDPRRALDIFARLSDRVGPGRVVWRFDPILVTNKMDAAEHLRLFSKIAAALEGKTKRVVISVADLYPHARKHLAEVQGLTVMDFAKDHPALLNLARSLAATAAAHGMEIQSCAETVSLTEAGILPGKCVDDALLREEFGLALGGAKDKGQRPACGCIPSRDIGAYNTCLHGCAYCYATTNEAEVTANKRRHDPDSPLLVGGSEDVAPELLLPPVRQAALFG